MGKIQSAVTWAIQTANDNSHGYSQADRWGPDFDCSSFVIEAYQRAGIPVRSKGASYTGNMRAAFIACGFMDVTNRIGLATGYGLQAGDVLLNYSAHTCMFIGNGKVANCRTDEGHPQAGDQSGNEIRIQSYWNFPWNCVLRFAGDNTIQEPAEQEPKEDHPETPPEKEEDHSLSFPLLQNSNSYNTYCVLLQALLNARHFACGSADGFYGAKTQAAVTRAQTFYGIEVDGVCGKETWGKLWEETK